MNTSFNRSTLVHKTMTTERVCWRVLACAGVCWRVSKKPTCLTSHHALPPDTTRGPESRGVRWSGVEWSKVSGILAHNK
jgi:hypothetical protein